MHNFTHSLLDRLKRDHRVVILDRPGSGYSKRAPGASAALSAQARTIARFAQELGLTRPLVVGHSLGGAIALSLALDHPGAVGGLALIAPVTHPQPRVPAPFQRLAVPSPVVRALIAWTLAVPTSIANRNRVLDVLFGLEPVPADFAIRGGALLALRPASFIGASSDLVAAATDLAAMPARYGELAMPVGILYGTADKILDPRVHGEAFAAKLPGVDFELIDDGSHMILISSADRAAAFIARMAQRVAAAEATPAPVA
jgi:pimeloyl-ACP methyl ester carboxylesterase